MSSQAVVEVKTADELIGLCDLCGQGPKPRYPVCTRRGCDTPRHVCIECLEENYYKFIVITGGGPMLKEAKTVLQQTLEHIDDAGIIR